jgi:choline dehydrogenase-like flavoprotein
VTRWDAVIVGSGFGGALTAQRLVDAGARVLLIERGDWVPRGPRAWLPDASLERTTSYATDVPYRRGASLMGTCACVGGPSVYYGGVSLRYRELDFIGDRDVVADSGAAWPYRYDELEPYYADAERLLGIAGDDAVDPTAPRRSSAFPFTPASLAPVSKRVVDSGRSLGLSPFPLPLAINHVVAPGRPKCVACRTCDTFACAIEAKNDLATVVIRPLLGRGLELWSRAIAVRLDAERGRIRRLYVQRKDRSETVAVEANIFVVAAGALATPHLLLASKLDELSPARGAVGRYLLCHDKALVLGLFRSPPDPTGRFHKQVGIHDWYFGDPGAPDVAGLHKLGGVQQVTTPAEHAIRASAPSGLKALAGTVSEHVSGLLCIVEDQPRVQNAVTIDWRVRDVYGLPQLAIHHRYSSRDRRATGALVRRSKRLLRRMGAVFSHAHHLGSLTHAVGTVRMGTDPATSPLDHECRFRGVSNLWVTDGSALPMSAGVNPSLTIAANALRAADAIARTR